jgi:hypothetical protein
VKPAYGRKVKLQRYNSAESKWETIYTYKTDNKRKASVTMTIEKKDRQKMTFGGDYCANERSHSFFGRMHYRAGFSYATPYIKVNDQNGPKEFSVSAGVGIPIVNSYNNRSMLNISAQWTNRSASGLIKENSFRINVGLTFNERWFAKFKVD